MTIRKGQVLNPKGRPKGSINRVDRETREVIGRFVDNNLDRFLDWLTMIDNPKDRVNCFLALLEFNIPKLQRTEVTGKDGKDLTIEVVKFSE